MGVGLELRHLRLLAAIADEGGVTSASRRLHLTQSALSHQLRDAEDRLGTALFLRVKKRMVLTPAGEQLLAVARRILVELEETEQRLAGVGTGEAGTLRFSTECYTCYHWLPPVMKAFQRSFPGVDLRIELDATHRALSALVDGKLEVAIIDSAPRDRRLQLHPLFEDEMVLLMHQGHWLSRRDHVRAQDFAGETLLIYPSRKESVLLRLVASTGVEPRAVLEVPLTEAILEMVRAGLGVALLARWAMSPRLLTRIVKRPFTPRGLRRQWKAATLRSRPPSPPVQEFLRLLSQINPVRAIGNAQTG